MTETIRKAVFPVAGLGTRFLPATKATAKEMLPVVDKPLIQYAVEEAVEGRCHRARIRDWPRKALDRGSLRPRSGARAGAGIAGQEGIRRANCARCCLRA